MEMAERLEQAQRDAGVRAAARQANETSDLFDGVHCIEPDCGEPIPQARLALNKVRCVTCQAAREKRK